MPSKVVNYLIEARIFASSWKLLWPIKEPLARALEEPAEELAPIPFRPLLLPVSSPGELFEAFTFD